MASILVENSTNRVVYITEGEITLESDRAVTPDRIFAPFNASNATVYTGVTTPTNDSGRYTYDGSVFSDTWPFQDLSRVQFLDALQDEGGVSDADLVASRSDSNLAAFWIKFELAESIGRDDTKTQEGLASLVSLGYLTSSGKQAVLDNWPKGRTRG